MELSDLKCCDDTERSNNKEHSNNMQYFDDTEHSNNERRNNTERSTTQGAEMTRSSVTWNTLRRLGVQQ
jgi:hypothetical protein